MVHYIDIETLTKNYRAFSEFGNIYFPLKTNSTKEIVYSIYELGASMDKHNGFLVSTLEQAQKIVGYAKSMSATMINTLETAEHYVDYYNLGIRKFVVADRAKLNALLKNVPESSLNGLEVIIKLSLSDITGVTSNTETSMVEEPIIRDIAMTHRIKCGVSVYIPNDFQSDIATFEGIMNMLRNYGMHHDISSISIGGLGGIKEMRSQDQEKVWGMLRKLKTEQSKFMTDLRLEPGKPLMDNVVSTECKVISKVITEAGYAITIEGSTYGEFWDAVALKRNFVVAAVNGIRTVQANAHTKEVQVYGDSGDLCDKITSFNILNGFKVDIGDTLIILDTGYYFGRQ